MGKKGRKTKQTQKHRIGRLPLPVCPEKKHHLLKIGNGAFLSVPPIGMHFNIEYCFNGGLRKYQEHPKNILRAPY